MRKLAVLIPLAWAGYSAPLAANDAVDAVPARAVFVRICVDEATKLGHRDAVLKKYVEACVNAKLKVLDDRSDPAAANLPESC